MPIQYTEEELRLVHEPDPAGDAAAAAAAAPAPVAAVPVVDQQALLRKLMDNIPTSKDGVWSYSIRWDAYDKDAMGPKFTKWIGQKVSSGQACATCVCVVV